MQTLLHLTLIALLLTTASFSARAQTTPPPEVIEPDGICAQITIPDPDNPAPATIEVNDETDPDCHTPGIIYQQADDTVIDATVDTTATDWATRCRALGVGTGPVGVGEGAAGQPHTYEDTARTRVTGGGSSGCAVWTSYARDHGRRYRTVWDCHEASAHTTAEGDGHAHDWLAEPWLAWQWTEVACWTVVNTMGCPPPAPDEPDTRGSYSFSTCSGEPPEINQPPPGTPDDPDDPENTEPPGDNPEDPTEPDPTEPDPTEPDPTDPPCTTNCETGDGPDEQEGPPEAGTDQSPAPPTAPLGGVGIFDNVAVLGMEDAIIDVKEDGSITVTPTGTAITPTTIPSSQDLTGADPGDNDDGGIDGFTDGGWTDPDGFGVACFNETAQVETANGTTRSAIEIRIGDTLRTQTGTATVRAVYHDTRAKRWVAINGETPFVTATHPMVTARGLVKGRDLKSGDRVQKSDGTWMEITTIEIRPIEQTSVNIETANDEAYVVNGLWFGSYGTYAME